MTRSIMFPLVCAMCAVVAVAGERTERFDSDPGWDAHNNRVAGSERRTVRQDFGFSNTAHAGGRAGEIGGFITPSAEPAYYGKRIAGKSFDDVLTASGTLRLDGWPLHVLVGFFHSKTVNEWRTPNTIALRLSGRGDVFYAWLEYATSRWRAGGDDPRGFPTVRDPVTGRAQFRGFPVGSVYRWTLEYNPKGNGGAGVVRATIGDETAICNLAAGHKADGASFDRFGILNVSKSADSGGALWMDNVTVNGERDDLDADPGWDGFHNRETWQTANVRPWFDFGYSVTNHSGGAGRGEMGGLVFRGDCRYPNTLAYYGDRLDELTLARPIRAKGKVVLRRGVTDSTVLIGFFHSEDSVQVNPSQDSGLPRNFLGIVVDGPSREGFFYSPAYRTDGDARGHGIDRRPPYIYPDGRPRDWSLTYDPGAADANGRIRLSLDDESVELEVPRDHKAAGARFNRFGIVTTWIDGNGQQIYLDDLTYTSSHDAIEPVATVARRWDPLALLLVATVARRWDLLALLPVATVARRWDLHDTRRTTSISPIAGAWPLAPRGHQVDHVPVRGEGTGEGCSLSYPISACVGDIVLTHVLTGHTGSVMSAAFSPAGDVLVTSSRDATIRVWDTATWKLDRTLTAHTEDVYAVAFSPDGRLLASASADKTIRLWDARSWQPLRALSGHDDVVRAVAFAPDGSALWSSSADRTVRRWRVSDGALDKTLTGHTGQVRALAIAPDGKRIATAGTDRTARLWNGDTGSVVHQLDGLDGSIESAAFAPDGATVALSSSAGTIYLWTARDGTIRRKLEGHDGEIDSIAYSPDGRVLFSGSKDRTIKVWNAATGELLHTVGDQPGRVESMAISQDRRWLVTGSGGGATAVRIWDTNWMPTN